jgi:hypothetical protein
MNLDRRTAAQKIQTKRLHVPGSTQEATKNDNNSFFMTTLITVAASSRWALAAKQYRPRVAASLGEAVSAGPAQ